MKLQKFDNYINIFQVEIFQEEFEKVLNESNQFGRYHAWLRRKLAILDSCVRKPLADRDLEPLSDTNPKLYAIRYPKSPKNPRVIYAYIDNGRVCLLHTFKESSKKSTSDYNSAIKTATRRLQSIEE